MQAKVGDSVDLCVVVLPFAGEYPSSVCSSNLPLNTSGSAQAVSQHTVEGLSLWDAPATVTVTVLRDGQQVAAQTFTPSYQVV
ncbi:MAG: hypothetical protein ACOYOB_17215 [Myxococcota bacterium]